MVFSFLSSVSCFASSPLFPRRVCASEASDKTTRFTRRTGPTLRRIRIFSRFALPPSSRSGLFFAACPFPFFLSVSFFAWRRVLFLLWQTFFLATLFFCFLVYCLLAELFFFVCLESSSCHLSGLFSRGGTAGEETRVALVALFARRSGNTVQKKNRTKRECGGGTGPGGRVAGTRGYFDFSGGGDGRDIPVSGSMK